MPIRSLYLKVFLPIAALVLAAMATVSFFAMQAMGEGVRLVAEQRARYGLAYVRSSVEDVEHVMLADRGVGLERMIERLGRSPDTEAVRILSVSGKVLHSSRPAEVGLMMPGHVPALPASASRENNPSFVEERSGFVHAAGAVFNHSRCSPCHAQDRNLLAFVDIDISLSRQSAGMRSWGEMATAAAALQFAFIGVGVALILGLIVVRPIRRLSERMSEVQHGNLDVTAVATGTVRDRPPRHGIQRDGRQAAPGAPGRGGRAARPDGPRGAAGHARRDGGQPRPRESATPCPAPRPPSTCWPGRRRRKSRDGFSATCRRNSPALTASSGSCSTSPGPRRRCWRGSTCATLIDDAVMLSRPRAAAQGATLEVQAGSEALDVLADADMVRQVIVNLIINALQACEGTPGARIDVSTGILDGQAACRVRDSGPGVPADRADAIFRPFVTTKPRGTGLGLATSRRLVELQGGRLWLENPGAPGACFTFTLPVFTGREGTGA